MIFPEEMQEYDPVQVGQRIQKIRFQKGIKTIDMAVQVDVSKNHYSRIEYGETTCSSKIVHKIAQSLEVSADYLLYGHEDDMYMSHIYALIREKTPKEIEKVIEVIRIIVS